jgi:hypothetical protein
MSCADGAHLPVEDGGDARRIVGRDDRVAEAVVAVHHGRRERLGHAHRQPGGRLDDRRQVARAVHLPELGEAAHLALEVAAGSGEG